MTKREYARMLAHELWFRAHHNEKCICGATPIYIGEGEHGSKYHFEHEDDCPVELAQVHPGSWFEEVEETDAG